MSGTKKKHGSANTTLKRIEIETLEPLEIQIVFAKHASAWVSPVWVPFQVSQPRPKVGPTRTTSGKSFAELNLCKFCTPGVLRRFSSHTWHTSYCPWLSSTPLRLCCPFCQPWTCQPKALHSKAESSTRFLQGSTPHDLSTVLQLHFCSRGS